MVNFSVATTEKWRDKATGEMKEATEWHNVSAFAGLAEICGKYLKKGSQVFIQGKIQTRKYTDKDGIERYTTGIRADEMKMLGGRPEGDGQQRQASQQQPQGSGFDDMSDDIPF